MRKLPPLFLLALALCGTMLASPVNGSPCKTTAGALPAPPPGCAVTVQATAGNTGVFFVASDSGFGMTFTVADSTHDSVTPCGAGVSSPTFFGGGPGGTLMAYLVSFATTGPEIVTATPIAPAGALPAQAWQAATVGILQQYTGALHCDRSAGGFGAGTTAAQLCRTCTRQQFMAVATANTPTTSQANELLVSAFFSYGTAAPTAGQGFTIEQRENILNGFFGILEDETVAATGAYAGTANVQNDLQWMGLVVTLHT